jgi:uncharacterized protein YehS (DUF1456 family)
MARATDPQRMNWLWQLFCEVAEIRPPEVLAALHALQIPVDLQRVRSWTVSDRDDGFFPVSIAEVERNLRALVVSRRAKREEGGVSANRSQVDAPIVAVDVSADKFAMPEHDAFNVEESLA